MPDYFTHQVRASNRERVDDIKTFNLYRVLIVDEMGDRTVDEAKWVEILKVLQYRVFPQSLPVHHY